MPVAFVLSIGGVDGDFQVGALRYLHNRGIIPDIVCGSSAGAINAAAIAQGEGGLDVLEATWLGLNDNSDLYVDQPWLSNLPGEVRGLLTQNLFKAVGAVGVPGLLRAALGSGPLGIPVILLGAIVTLQSVNQVKGAVNQFLQQNSTADPSPLERRIFDGLNRPTVPTFPLGTRLRVAVTQLEGGQLRLVNEHGQFIDADASGRFSTPSEEPAVDLTQAVLASGAIPLFFPPVRLNRYHYIDGGARTFLPVQAALDAGATRVFAIAGPPTGVVTPYKTGIPAVDTSGFGIVSGKVVGIAYDSMLCNALNPPGHFAVPTVVIQRTLKNLSLGMNVEPGLIWIAMGYGYMRAADVLHAAGDPELFTRLSENSDAITNLRVGIWVDECGAHGHPPPDFFAGVLPAPPRGGWLASVRSKKQALAELVMERLALFGKVLPHIGVTPNSVNFMDTVIDREASRVLIVRNMSAGPVPPDAAKWWMGWERHPWPTKAPDPWSASPAVRPPTAVLPTASIRIHAPSIPPPFRIGHALGDHPVGGSLPEGGTIPIRVSFTPRDEHFVSETLTIHSDAGSATVRLTGQGVRLPKAVTRA
ncbi:MAG: hypothetical protein E6H00_00795 [Bacillati bacterium ANGP1]|uniref:PNPLA domain-containing protein n=1 Tax=Candidatus Segetimicrobium genomatis TaxID=2569760 RepID=A0A537KD80_9BACT|nr:MAG: hypothetical protein E6H00_00795 [Terrabacteria group bacterium ANGP1]